MEEIQTAVNTYLIEGKSQKAILTTLQDKYEKKLIKKAVQSSPVTIMNNTQVASIFMFFSTLIGILIGPFILDSDIVKFQTFEWVMISIMALFFFCTIFWCIHSNAFHKKSFYQICRGFTNYYLPHGIDIVQYCNWYNYKKRFWCWYNPSFFDFAVCFNACELEKVQKFICRSNIIDYPHS